MCQNVLLHVSKLRVSLLANRTVVGAVASVNKCMLLQVGSLCELFVANVARKFLDLCRVTQGIR